MSMSDANMAKTFIAVSIIVLMGFSCLGGVVATLLLFAR